MSYLRMLQEPDPNAHDGHAPQLAQPRSERQRPSDWEIARAMRLLNLAGVRIMRNGSDLQIGVWEDLDVPEVRAAIHTVGLDVHPVVHLEGPGVEIRYKVRRTPDRVKGESFAFWLRRAERELPSILAASDTAELEQPA